MKPFPHIFVLAIALAASPAALPHGGEDHGDAPHPVAASLAPRFEARSEAFELVGILDQGDLVLFLDRADSNSPVVKANIDLEAGAYKARATAGKSGEFRLAAGPLAQPGRHALTITVETDADTDLLAAALEVGATAKAAAATPQRGDSPALSARAVPVALGAAVLGAILAGLMVLKRRST